MTTFTPLDSLKECAARGHLTLSHVLNLLHTPDALGLPAAIDALIAELTDLHNLLVVESFFAHVNPDSPDRDFYSDGRPVRTQLEIEDGFVHQQVWSADPRSARDHPRIVAEFRTPSDTHWRVVILRPGEVDGIRVQDDDQ
jgi:hypothetical protein